MRACNLIKGVVITAGGISSIFVISGLYNEYITHNISISEPTGYYLKLPVGNIKKDSRYLVCLDKPQYVQIMHELGLPYVTGECSHRSPYILKQVAGLPNDTIVIGESGVFVNRHYQINSKPIQIHKNIDLLPISAGYSYKLKADEYFLMGVTRTSYDSRYFGVVQRNQFYKHAILLMNDK